MIIPTLVFVLLIIIINHSIQLSLRNTSVTDDVKLGSIQKINTVLFVVILCYVSLFVARLLV